MAQHVTKKENILNILSVEPFLRFQIKKTDGINIKFKNLRATLSIVIDLSIDHIVEIII